MSDELRRLSPRQKREHNYRLVSSFTSLLPVVAQSLGKGKPGSGSDAAANRGYSTSNKDAGRHRDKQKLEDMEAHKSIQTQGKVGNTVPKDTFSVCVCHQERRGKT